MLECPLTFHRLSSQAASFTRDNYPQHHCVVVVPAWEYRGRIASVPNVDKHNTGVSSSQDQAPSDDLHLCTTMLPNIDFHGSSGGIPPPPTLRRVTCGFPIPSRGSRILLRLLSCINPPVVVVA
mmetsp:Transcript_16126/g.34910  ORF Transcript_16126/g.34910 Transcript_16126/m.34910 type:complete len:124 (+) Transcript_16126:78-449(+)